MFFALAFAVVTPALAASGTQTGGGVRSSAYLAALHAQYSKDAPRALAFYQQALAGDPTSTTLRMRTFGLALSEGRFDIAAPLARTLAGSGAGEPLGSLVVAVEELRAGKAQAALAAAERLPDNGIFRYVRAIVVGWSEFAVSKRVDKAIAPLTDPEVKSELGPLMPLQAALIADLGGDQQEAEKHYAEAKQASTVSLRLTQLFGNFLERTNRAAEAKAAYDSFVAVAQPELSLAPHVSDKSAPARLIADPAQGLAESLFQLSGILEEGAAAELAQITVRLSLRLRPDFAPAQLILADTLQHGDRNGDALAVLQGIDRNSAFAFRARLREADLLDRQGKLDASLEALKQLCLAAPQQVEPQIQLADTLRAHDRFAEAVALYNKILSGGAPKRVAWSLHFSRAVAYERSGDWANAEADLRKALELSPEQPDVLNYLGYGLVDRQEKLEEATQLIRRAVSLRPDDGYIVDSLGWALFRQGKLDDAQATLERAAELKPGDPEINDHLGDAYWQGGRNDEARLQWRRALSLQPTKELSRSIESKLDAHKPATAQAGRGG